MKRSVFTTAALAVALVGLAGCGEKPQTSARKPDGKAWESAGASFAAPGFKPGNEAAWDEQMRVRAQGQNEYSRATVAQ